MGQPKKSTKLTVITTHVNADFDALASMLAAQKLYPDAVVVFPGSQEKNLRNFFISSMVYLFNIADIKTIDFDTIGRLVLVDTRQASRIGKFAALLEHDDIEIHTYDHHPHSATDIAGDYGIHRLTGATVTLLTEIIRERSIHVTADEATIMCLGIYEDTGSFTFPSTTAQDFEAAGFLLSKGANLNVIADLIAREISPQQVELLNEMIQGASRMHLNGIDLLVTSISTDSYIPDFAYLVHKMVKMEGVDAIFAIGRMENKIYVVARSRVQEVDVGDILAALGGGGHPYAAAATIKNRTLVQVEHQLIEILQERVRSRRSAKDLMSSPPITVDLAVACREAADLLTRYNINALLVTQKQNGNPRLRGIISRQVIEKALYHELGHVPVEEYMTTELATVEPDADLEEIQTKIIENQQRLLPVIEGESLVGVVTRTDLLAILIRQSQRSKTGKLQPAQEHLHARTRNIVKFMRERLPARLIEILRQIGRVAADLGCDAYVVGGFVRDLLLYRANEDLDIVIEGDGIAFARAFAPLVQARVHSHAKFGTAVIIFPDGLKIDVASARMEYYKFPAALPTVEMSSIKLDLFRRDFTINTLAIQLNKEKFGILIDFFSAQKDIKEKVIRVLHNLSFVEDPTRVFRAIRFEQRFAFTIGKLTSGLINNAVKMDFLQRLSGRRVLTELRLILSEENPTPAIVRLDDYNLLQIIHPDLELDDELIGLFNAAKKVLAWHDLLFLEETYMKWSVYFMILLCHRTRQTSVEICQRLEMAPRLRKIFVEERFSAERCLYEMEQRLPDSNSRLFRRLDGFRIELILYAMARTREEKVKKAISRYITRLRTVSIHLRGRDLLAMGLKPGPIFRETLQAVFDAKLDGKIKTPADELAVARKLIASREAS